MSKILQAICVECGEKIVLHTLASPQIDACGFERYEFDCIECKSRLVGIIDPYDDALLLSTD